MRPYLIIPAFLAALLLISDVAMMWQAHEISHRPAARAKSMLDKISKGD